MLKNRLPDKTMHEDHRFIEALRQHNPGIIREIYRQFARQALHWIVQRNGSAADAEDVPAPACQLIQLPEAVVLSVSSNVHASPDPTESRPMPVLLSTEYVSDPEL